MREDEVCDIQEVRKIDRFREIFNVFELNIIFISILNKMEFYK